MAYNNDTGPGIIGVLLIMMGGWLLGVEQDPKWLEIVGLGFIGSGLIIEIKLLDRFQFRLAVIEQRLGIRS